MSTRTSFKTKVPSWILYAGPAAEAFHKSGGKFSVNPPGGRTLVMVDLEGKRLASNQALDESSKLEVDRGRPARRGQTYRWMNLIDAKHVSANIGPVILILAQAESPKLENTR